MTTGSVVHVIDDDDAARESLRFLLESAHLTVRAYPSAKEFLEALPDVEDGCIVTDVKMPDIDGLELIRHVKSHKTNLPVIAITGHGDVALAVDVMRAGAVNFIEKPYEDEVMLGAVRSALSVRAVDARLDGEKPEIRARLVALSPRERQVLDGLVAGHQNKAIAHELGISSRTVEIYRANVMAKMQAANLSQLLRMVLTATA